MPPPESGRARRVALMTSLNSAIRSPFQQPESNFFARIMSCPSTGGMGVKRGCYVQPAERAGNRVELHRPDQSECLSLGMPERCARRPELGEGQLKLVLLRRATYYGTGITAAREVLQSLAIKS
jgi:hypothetical protein